ncbi:MAG: hypothetical protein GX660_21180 [Clostridiaceae bacterium]|nr:hypothetical protein [Clostridiaceae bacterium]
MEELKRQYRVIDMLLTMHSYLRDHYRNLSMAVNLIIMGSSIIICASVFIDSSAIKWFGFNNGDARMVIGLFSILVFFLSLVSLICDWGNTSEKHEHAAVSLSCLKGECRDLLRLNPPPNEGQINQWISSCRIHLNGLPIKIPEKKFNKLKAKHKRKIELSKLTDEFPGSSIIILRIIVWFRANRDVIKAINNKVEERGT